MVIYLVALWEFIPKTGTAMAEDEALKVFYRFSVWMSRETELEAREIMRGIEFGEKGLSKDTIAKLNAVADKQDKLDVERGLAWRVARPDACKLAREDMMRIVKRLQEPMPLWEDAEEGAPHEDELKKILEGIQVGDKGKIENFGDSMARFDGLEAKLEAEKKDLEEEVKKLGLETDPVISAAREKFHEAMNKLERQTREKLKELGAHARAKWEGEEGIFANLGPLDMAHKKGSLYAKVDKILVEAGDMPRSIAELKKVIAEAKEMYPEGRWDDSDANMQAFLEHAKEARAKLAAAEEFKFPHFDVEARPKVVVKAKRRKGYPRLPRDEVRMLRGIDGRPVPKRVRNPADDPRNGAPVRIVVQDAPEAIVGDARVPQGQILRAAGEWDARRAHAAVMQAGLHHEPAGPHVFQALRMDRYGRPLPPDEGKAPMPRAPPDEKSKTVMDVKTPSTSTAEVAAPAGVDDAAELPDDPVFRAFMAQDNPPPPLPADVAWDIHPFPPGRLAQAGIDREELRREGLRFLLEHEYVQDAGGAHHVGAGMWMAPARGENPPVNILA